MAGETKKKTGSSRRRNMVVRGEGCEGKRYAERTKRG